MSHTRATSTSSNFQPIFDNALKAYKKRTKEDLLTHPLADRLEACNSASSILTVLQEQVQELNQSQRRNERWTKWLDPTVKVVYAFSETLGEGVTLVCLSSQTCLRSVLSYLFNRHLRRQKRSLPQVLLLVCILRNMFVPPIVMPSPQAAKNVRASQDALFEIFERLEAFFQRLEIYTGAALDPKMVDTVTKIMAEVLSIIGIATKEVKLGRKSMSFVYKEVSS